VCINEEIMPKNDTEVKKKFSANLIIPWFKAKSIRWISIIVLILIAGFFTIKSISSQSNTSTTYQTVIVERGDLIAIVGATGVVEAKQTSELNWQTTGRVDNVFVNVNTKVKAGEILADLADNTLPQSVILAQSDLVTARKNLEDLINSNTSSAEAYRNLLTAESDLRDAKETRDDWNYNGASWERIYTARSEFIRLEEELKVYQSAYNAVVDLPTKDPKRVEAKSTLDKAQLARDKALRTINFILGKSYDRQVAEDFADYDLAYSKVQDAQREWERVKGGTNKDDISAAEARVAASEATVSLGWLEAPFDGTVTRAYPKKGDEVITGNQGFRVDDLSELFVKVNISEVDINRVIISQPVDLSFDAVTGKTYKGEVTEVSSVGVDNGSGVDFEVTLKILEPDEKVRPGMTAAVNIIVSEIKNILIIPNRAIRLKDGQRIVYALNAGQLIETKVDVGSSSDTQTEILDGSLKEGDVVVLNPPTMFQTNGRPPSFVRQ
jgi:HlyD family secretion protein